MKQLRLYPVVLLCFFVCFLGEAFAVAAAEQNLFDRKKNQILGYILGKQLPMLHYSAKPMDDELSQAIFTLYIKQLDHQKRFLLQSDVDHLSTFADSIDDELLQGQIVLPDTGYDILSSRIDDVEVIVEKLLENTRVQGLLPENGSSSQLQRGQESRYRVVKGDTFAKIAEKFPGRTVDALRAANNDLVSNDLRPGTVMTIPAFQPVPERLVVGSFDMLKVEFLETDAKKDIYALNLAALEEKWRKILKMQIISEFLDLEKERAEARRDGKSGEDQIGSKNDIALWQQSIKKILKRNRTFFQRLRQETLQDHYDRFFNSVARAFGPHTNYISPASKEQFDIHMRGSLEGIGAMLREEDGLIKVSSIVPGSASYKNGELKAGDTILAVGQEGEEPVDITEMRLRDAVRLIRGPKGSTVILIIRKPDGGKRIVSIIRDVVQLEETFVRSALLQGPNNLRVGYIYIPSFYRDFEGKSNAGGVVRNSTADTRTALEGLKEQFAQGMILDLRDDGGGALIDAVDIAGLFIESGPVVTVKNSFGVEKRLEDYGAAAYEGPLVVLVNKFSASASEIVAAALQDYGRAVIVGDPHTHGKGTVQTVVDLNKSKSFFPFSKAGDLGALKVMIQKFYRVTGGSTQYKGVEPDIVLPSLLDHIKSGERYLDYSLPWDSIKPVDFTPWPKDLHLEKIKKLSAGRVAKDEDFALIREIVAKAVARSEQTSLSVTLPDLHQQRFEAQESEEKIGDLYRLHALSEDGENDNGVELTREEKQKKWLEKVNKDPYIREGINIVADLRKLQGKK